MSQVELPTEVINGLDAVCKKGGRIKNDPKCFCHVKPDKGFH